MPHFTLPFEGIGPIVLTYVSVSEERAKALTTARQLVPAPVQIHASVDTGAIQTNVSESIMTGRLGLVEKNVVQVGTASTNGDQLHLTRQYDAAIVAPVLMKARFHSFGTRSLFWDLLHIRNTAFKP